MKKDPAAQTSVKQCAAIIKQYAQDHKDTPGGACLDYGAGKYSDAADLLNAELGMKSYRMDRYWQTLEVNLDNFINSIQDNDLRVIFCANVLNVCLKQEDRFSVLRDLRAVQAANGHNPEILISVYEKNKNGQPDGVQLNWPAAMYEEEIKDIFTPRYYNISRKGNVYRITFKED